MPSGSAIELFNDFMLATGATIVKGPRDIQLEAVFHNYFIAQIIQGESVRKRLLQGGRSVRSHYIFRDSGTYRSYQPGEYRTYKNAQRLKMSESFFRFQEYHISWLEQEILLNEVANAGSADAQYHQFASVRDVKKAAGEADKWNGMERALFAVPNKDTMEGESGGGDTVMDPYGLIPYINEYGYNATTGLATGLFKTGWASGAWTTLEGIDPTAVDVDGRFSVTAERYSDDGIASGQPEYGNGPLEAFDRAFLRMRWDTPNALARWRDDERYNKLRIITSMKGRTHLIKLMRAGNDRYALGPQDPGWPDPQIYGIPVQWSEAFQQGAYYQTAVDGTLTTELDTAAESTGPRYMLWNGTHLWPYFHREKYMVAEPPMRQFNVPDAWVMRGQVWWNMKVTSRQSQGIIFPATGDIITAAS